MATTTQSNGDGSFVVPGLIAGTYTVKIVKTGFQTYTEEHLVLTSGSTTALNADTRGRPGDLAGQCCRLRRPSPNDYGRTRE